MPQMSPLSWTILVSSVMLMIILISVNTSKSKNQMKKENKIFTKKKNFTW